MTDTEFSTTALVDATAQVIADAVEGTIFAAGVTDAVTDLVAAVVPLADDFTEIGLPMVTCALGAWHPALQPGNERYGRDNPFEVLCSVWRPRVPLGQNVNLLYGDRDRIADAFLERSKGYMAEPHIQAVILAGGTGIVARSLPAGSSTRSFLTLPFTVQFHLNRTVVPKPQ